MKFPVLRLLLCFSVSTSFAQKLSVEASVEKLISQMTIQEKLAQISQANNPVRNTGPTTISLSDSAFLRKIAIEQYGSVLNAWGAQTTRKIQEVAIQQTRLKIPILFGADVIHGFKTVFPIPLAEAASWDPTAAELSARIAAIEAASAGLHWTFAPMVDIARDPRWGRVAEGSGEDVFLGCAMAKARVKGFQGTDLKDPLTILACAKHFVAYGQAEGGRDYNTTDMSERVLRETYLPPFKATVDAGVATMMSSFNELNGTPASGSRAIQTDILRGEWGFKGFVVSDWASVTEMLPYGHGAAKNKYEAAWLGFGAGVDMEMVSNSYRTELPRLIQEGKIKMAEVDASVRRILLLKHALGLFEDPYRYCNDQREKVNTYHPKHIEAARDVARKSIVLLKNDGNVLPLSKTLKKIALIGPLADAQKELNGTWALMGEDQRTVTLKTALINALPQTQILYHKGCAIDSNEQNFDDAIALAKTADVVVVNLGESKRMSGEAASRMSIHLPGAQDALLSALKKTGKPIVLVLTNGRPLVLTETQKNADAILESWFLGTETGNALVDVLLGKYNPSGKLPMSFPYHQGQIPVYYNHKNTGRPFVGKKGYNSSYLDGPNEPFYPFGYGLSYSTFEIGKPILNKDSISANDTLTIEVEVRNTGSVKGKETVQCYLRDLYAFGVGRPVKELKAFQSLELQAGESKRIRFKLSKEDFSFYNLQMQWTTEPGEMEIQIGNNSRDVQKLKFKLL